jgi:hypothetical protein
MSKPRSKGKPVARAAPTHNAVANLGLAQQDLPTLVEPVDKKKSASVKPLTAKQRQEEEAEEGLIQWHLDSVKERANRPVPTGQRNLHDFKEAIGTAAKESNSLLLDWTSETSMLIGRTCKVYWALDKEWYYARILYYDKPSDKYFVSTASLLQ